MSALHLAILYGESVREKHDQGWTGKIFTDFVAFCSNWLPTISATLPADAGTKTGHVLKASEIFRVTSRRISCSTSVTTKGPLKGLLFGGQLDKTTQL